MYPSYGNLNQIPQPRRCLPGIPWHSSSFWVSSSCGVTNPIGQSRLHNNLTAGLLECPKSMFFATQWFHTSLGDSMISDLSHVHYAGKFFRHRLCRMVPKQTSSTASTLRPLKKQKSVLGQGCAQFRQQSIDREDSGCTAILQALDLMPVAGVASP